MSKIYRYRAIEEWVCTLAYKILNVQKQNTVVVPCILAFKFDSPQLRAGGFPHPSQVLLDSLFCEHYRASYSTLRSLGQVSTTLHPNPKLNVCMPVWSAPGTWILRWWLWNAVNCLKKKRYYCNRHNCFWGLFLAHVASGQLLWLQVVKAQPMYFQWFASVAGNSAARDVRGRELVWWLYGKLIISGIVILSFSCEYRFTYLQKEQWRIVISRNIHLLAETSVKWLNSF